MLPRPPDQMTDVELDAWIKSLVDTAEPEGIRLDYKQEIKTKPQRERRELAKDITSFANEIGGALVYGVPENRTDPEAPPTPARPYGVEPIPGLVQDIDNILATAITPLVPEYRIRVVALSEYPGKVCYVVWTPESWIGPHMVHGYQEGRFYRRGQFRSVIMSEGDIEARYVRRQQVHRAANDFIGSEDATHLGQLYGPGQATTALMVVPLLFIPNRVAFGAPDLRQWLETKALWRGWSPSMRGVRITLDHGERADVELHRNGAIVAWRYTAVDDKNAPPLIAYVAELGELGKILTLAAGFYTHVDYYGPLAVSLTIHCPPARALSLPHDTSSIPLQPAGTSVRLRVDPSASELTASPNVVLRAIADELFRAFGLWEADCFDAENRLISRRGHTIP